MLLKQRHVVLHIIAHKVRMEDIPGERIQYFEDVAEVGEGGWVGGRPYTTLEKKKAWGPQAF